jgi:hypothetical protein
MAAARAEQSNQRERDECEFHFIWSLAVRQVLKKPRQPAWVSPGLLLCPGRQTDPAQHKRTGELVSERLRELVSERLRSARTAPVLGNAPNRPSIADEMREEHRRRVLGE